MKHRARTWGHTSVESAIHRLMIRYNDVAFKMNNGWFESASELFRRPDQVPLLLWFSCNFCEKVSSAASFIPLNAWIVLFSLKVSLFTDPIHRDTPFRWKWPPDCDTVLIKSLWCFITCSSRFNAIGCLSMQTAAHVAAWLIRCQHFTPIKRRSNQKMAAFLFIIFY